MKGKDKDGSGQIMCQIEEERSEGLYFKDSCPLVATLKDIY